MNRFLRKLTKFLRNPVTLASLIVFSIFCFFYFYKFETNIYGFFRIGSVLPFSPYLDRQQALIFEEELGFDGQQFLSLAFDPFLQNPGTIETLDSPRLRYRRIFYPLLAHALGFGNPQLIPYIMVGINLLCILILVWIVGQSLVRNQQRIKKSLWVLCIPGLWIVFSLSTADLLNSLLAIAAIYFYQNKRILPASLALAAAFLTKEISIMMGLALLLDSALTRRWKQIPYLIIAFIPAATWNMYVLIRLRSQGFLGVSENFGYPFGGLGQKLLSLWEGGLGGKNLFEAYSFFLILAIFAVNLLISTQNPQKNRIVFLGTLLYGTLFVASNMSMLSYFLNYPRQYMDVYFLLLLAQSDRYDRLKQSLMAAGGLSSAVFLLAHT